MQDEMVRTGGDRNSRLLSIQDVAQELNVSVRLVWRLVGSDELTRIRVGRCARITRESVDAYVAKGGSR